MKYLNFINYLFIKTRERWNITVKAKLESTKINPHRILKKNLR